MQVLDFNQQSLEKVVPLNWERDPNTGFVAQTAMATYRVFGRPIKGDCENMMWTVDIKHRYDDWRSVKFEGEDAIVVLSRASQRFKDNMKLLRMPIFDDKARS